MEKKVNVDIGMAMSQVTPGMIRGGMGRRLFSPGLATKLPVPGKDVTSGCDSTWQCGRCQGAEGWMLFMDPTPCSWVASWA